MKYNFDEIINRNNTASLKWDEVNIVSNGKKVIPLWVADTDFKAPVEVIESLQKRVDPGIFGYTSTSPTYTSTIKEWIKKRHNWEIEEEWITYTPGIVPAISFGIQTFSKEEDCILINTPIYPPFYEVPKLNNRKIIDNNLIYENNNDSIDFNNFEKQAKEAEIFLRPSASPNTTAGTYFHKFPMNKTSLEAFKTSFKTSSGNLATNTIEPFVATDSGAKSSAGIEFFRQVDSGFDKGAFTNSTDRLNQIAANFFDFFDEDCEPTCDLSNGALNLTASPKYFGNEMFPQISEISVALGGKITKQSLGRRDRVSVALKVQPAVELTDIYGVAQRYPNLRYKIEFKVRVTGTIKVKSGPASTADKSYDEELTIATNSPFKLSNLTKNDGFYIAYNGGGRRGFKRRFYLPARNQRCPRDSNISGAQLNLKTVQITAARLIIASGSVDGNNLSNTVVDFARPSSRGIWDLTNIDVKDNFVLDHSNEPADFIPRLAIQSDKDKALCSMNGTQSMYQLFSIQTIDPRVNTLSGNWTRENHTFPTNKELNYSTVNDDRFENLKSNFNDQNRYNIGYANKIYDETKAPAELYSIQNNFNNSETNKDYKNKFEQDFETVNSFGKLRHYFPNKLETTADLAAIGNISRAKAFQTLNVSKFNKIGWIGKYSDGDANILQQLKFSNQINSLTGKYNYKGFNKVALIALMKDAIALHPEIFKDYNNGNISYTLVDDSSKNGIINKIQTEREKTNYDAFNTSNNRYDDCIVKGENPEIYNFYGFKDFDLFVTGIKKSYDATSMTSKGQQQVEFLTSAMLANSSPRYFYYQLNTVSQGIIDNEAGTPSTSVSITKDLGEQVVSSNISGIIEKVGAANSTVYKLRSRKGAYDPYVDQITSTKKAKAIIRWDNIDKKFEVISYEKLEQ